MRFIFVYLLILSFVEAKSPYEKGQDLYVAKACYSCHGHRLEGMNTFPHLANRAKGYMAYKLKRFRSKKADTQAQEMMITYSVDLSDEEIARRKANFKPIKKPLTSSWLGQYRSLVTNASNGAMLRTDLF